MAPSDFANADIKEIVEELTLEEAISLIAGVGFWHTHGVPRLNIPAVKVSDGPNGEYCYDSFLSLGWYTNEALWGFLSGVRGNFFFMGTPAKCLPVRKLICVPHLPTNDNLSKSYSLQRPSVRHSTRT